MNGATVTCGIDLGGTDIKAVALDQHGTVVWRGGVPTAAVEGRDAVVQRLVEVVRAAEAHIAPSPLLAVGVAMPGVIDMPGGTVEMITNLTKDWNGFGLQGALEAEINLPVRVINDVRAATVAEHAIGAGRGYTDFLVVAIGTGIGGGVVINNQVYGGSRGAAAELGHQTLDRNGPQCACGSVGCLEAMASGPAIARAAAQAIAEGDDKLARQTGTRTPTPYQIAQAAEAGNTTARSIFTRAGEWIGIGMANLVVTLNPQAIVVGGGVAKAGDLLLAPIRAEIEKRTVVMPPERAHVEVLLSPLGGQAGAIGAGAWARQSVQKGDSA